MGDRIQKSLSATDQLKTTATTTKHWTWLQDIIRASFQIIQVPKPCNWTYPGNISTSDQRCFNVVDQRNNFVQRWFNLDTTLFQPSVDVIWSNIKSNRASHDYGFANT